MNTNLGLIGKKLGNTQIFTENGEVCRVSVVQAGPCVVLGKRTPETHGYSALQLGMGAKKEKHVNRPEAGFYKKLEQPAATIVREFRVPAETLANYEVGQTISAADVFKEGQFVDVSGTSKGRGFAGVMKRHNFAGAGSVGHGTHEYKRHGGSIGQNMTPGRTFRGMKMAGHYGAKKITMMNLRVVRVIAEDNVILVSGSVPGARGGFISLRNAAKKQNRAA